VVGSFNDATVPARIQASTAGQPVTPGAPPSTLQIYPNSGSTAGGSPVTISGSGFTGVTSVTIGGTAATGVVLNNDGMISATSPAHAAGSVNVVVTTPVSTSTLVGGYAYH
jgi:hypothetical protein